LIDVGKAELIAMMCAHDSFGGRVLNPENEKKSMDFCVVTGIKPDKTVEFEINTITRVHW
jgi:hypothetical protein